MKRALFITLVMCLLFVFSQCCEQRPSVFKIDHFKVYKVDRPDVVPTPIHVDLEDQFGHTSGGVSFIEYFANPVSKDGQKILDSTAHLAWYPISVQSSPEPKPVTIDNQFGTFQWELGKPAFLLVPTHKIEKGSQFPEKLDHFVCYDVLSADTLQRKVVLVDQFDIKLDRKEEVVVRNPLYLAVPVSKNNGEITNKSDHLACYEISPLQTPVPRDSMKIKYKNQFAEDSLVTRNSTMLCVPSKKDVVEEEE